MRNEPILLERLRDMLADIGSKLEAGRKIDRDLSQLADMFASIDPAELMRAEQEIVATASLHRWRPTPSLTARLFSLRVSDATQMEMVDGLGNLFIFHRDGRLREAALRKLHGPLPNPFLVMAVAWRLNDWAAPVRRAAADCAARTFPETRPKILAEAGLTLLTRYPTWGRLESTPALLDQVVSQRGVGPCMAKLLANRRTGPTASTLHHVLRTDSLDTYLDDLARGAVQPAVRATVLRSLIDGYVEWPNGWRWKWVDKSMGLRRRETVFERRSLTVGSDRNRYIVSGLSDRAAMVRKIAMSGLIRYPTAVADARQLASAMLTDRSAAVRRRAAFILGRSPSRPASIG
jgi:hypothetical protein